MSIVDSAQIGGNQFFVHSEPIIDDPVIRYKVKNMSEVEKLPVTLELPASELIDHDNGLYVRCSLNGTWVPLMDYYSETQGALLPLVGKVDYQESAEHWTTVKDENGNDVLDEHQQPKMQKVPKENPIVWKEVVRILPKGEEAPPEGGTLAFHVGEAVGTKDKF